MPIDTTSAPPPVSKSGKTTPITTQAKPPRQQKVKEQKAPSGKLGARAEALNGFMQAGAFGLIVAGQPADAGALGKYGPGIADEAAKLAEQNDGVARVIDYVTEVGPYAGLFTAAMPLVLQLLANHGVMKPEQLAGAGVVPPEALAAEVKADLARMQMEALRAQNAAEADLAQMQQEAAESQVPTAATFPDAPVVSDVAAQNGRAAMGAQI